MSSVNLMAALTFLGTAKNLSGSCRRPSKTAILVICTPMTLKGNTDPEGDMEEPYYTTAIHSNRKVQLMKHCAVWDSPIRRRRHFVSLPIWMKEGSSGEQDGNTPWAEPIFQFAEGSPLPTGVPDVPDIPDIPDLPEPPKPPAPPKWPKPPKLPEPPKVPHPTRLPEPPKRPGPPRRPRWPRPHHKPELVYNLTLALPTLLTNHTIRIHAIRVKGKFLPPSLTSVLFANGGTCRSA